MAENALVALEVGVAQHGLRAFLWTRQPSDLFSGAPQKSVSLLRDGDCSRQSRRRRIAEPVSVGLDKTSEGGALAGIRACLDPLGDELLRRRGDGAGLDETVHGRAVRIAPASGRCVHEDEHVKAAGKGGKSDKGYGRLEPEAAEDEASSPFGSECIGKSGVRPGRSSVTEVVDPGCGSIVESSKRALRVGDVASECQMHRDAGSRRGLFYKCQSLYKRVLPLRIEPIEMFSPGVDEQNAAVGRLQQRCH
jgi:hypothetical protein